MADPRTAADRRVDVLVVGAGPTGIGAAGRLAQHRGAEWLLVESADVPGGAAASWRDEAGFLWDMGGHVLHSHFPEFGAVLADAVPEWCHPVRDPGVWIAGRMVDGPVQQSLHRFPIEIADRVAKELADRSPQPRDDLASWFVDEFGPTLSGLFFEPFNHRMWAHPPAALAHGWTSLRSGGRSRNVPAAGRADGGNGLDRAERYTFPYPREGTGDMWRRLADRLPQDRIRYGTAVVELDPDHRIATLSDGTRVGFESCVSTMPLPVLTRMLAGDHAELAQAAMALHASAVEVVGFGFEGEPPAALAGRSWLHTADPDTTLHRATVLSSYSDRVAGPGRWSIMCETSRSAFRPVDPDGVAADSLATLRTWGVTADPVSVSRRSVPWGYPVPTLGRDAVLRPLHAALESFGIRSRGRFGGWRYESCNQDYSWAQGVQAVDAALHGAAEDVLWHPERY